MKVFEKEISIDPEDIPWDVDVPVNITVPPGKHLMEVNLSGTFSISAEKTSSDTIR